MSRWFLAALSFVLLATPVEAQGGLFGKIKQKAQQKASERVDAAEQEVVDTAASKTEHVVRCAVSDALCIANAQAAGQEVVMVDGSGQQVVENPSGQSVVENPSGSAAPPAAEPTPPDQQGTEPTPGAIDACALLTRDEIAQASGDHPLGPKGHTTKWPYGGLVGSSCRYRTQYGKLGAEITVERGRTPEEMAGMLQQLKSVATLEPVAGLGDQAWWGGTPDGAGMLHVVNGTDFLTLRVFGKAPGAGSLAKARELMAIAYPRYAALPPYHPQPAPE